jgi:hypothetical protein
MSLHWREQKREYMTTHIGRVISAVVLAITLASSIPVPAFAAQPVPSLAVPIVGTVTDAAGSVGSFTDGTLNVTRFVARDNQVFAIGTVSGLLTNASGVTTSIVTAVALPVDTAQATATCDILNLELAPLHLNLLGLVVDLNVVVLNITSTSGAGKLLGNLLCAIAGLTDNPGSLAGLLNKLLGALV